jgi:hypothetical protein
VFLDSTRAGGATVVAVYSPRVRPGAPVSFPVPWEDLDRVAPADFTVHTAIERLGGRVRKLPYDDWWNVIITSRVEGVDGLFVHPVQDPGVMAGNGTIGLEILEDLPDPDAVVIPYGGGGLTAGIANIAERVRALGAPSPR